MVKGRILVALTYYSPHLSGLTEYARIQAEGIAGLGYECDVLAYQHLPSLPIREALGGVDVHRVPPLLKAHKGIFSPHYLLRFRALAKAADIVHLHLPMLEAGALSLLLNRSKPMVVTYQCDLVPSQDKSLIDEAAVKVATTSAAICLKRATKILVSSLDYATESPLAKPNLRRCIELFPPDKAPLNLTPRGAPTQRRNVGFLGRFVEEKGIDVLLRAMKLVLEDRTDVHLRLAGDFENVPGGSQMGKLRSLLDDLGEHVELLGKVPEERLFDFYKSLDVFVLPSVNSYEAFGIVQLEAMKAGVPVVASDRRGMRVPIRETGNGRLFTAGDPRALADALLGIFENPPGSAESVSAKAWDRFSNAEFIERTDALYRTLI